MEIWTLKRLATLASVCLLTSACGHEEDFTVEGVVSGLTGSVKLILNAMDGETTLEVTSDGTFEIGVSQELVLTPDTTYSLAVLNHPQQQTCLVNNGSGAVPEGVAPIIVDGIEVNCVDGWSGIRQWGTNQNDSIYGGTLDGNDDIHMVGSRWQPYPTYLRAGWVSRFNGSQDVLLQTTGDTVFSEIVIDDLGNSYIVGRTEGELDNLVNQGGSDVLITKLDVSGEFVWSLLLGGNGYETATDVALDAAGHLFVVGYTDSENFEGNPTVGESDAFVMQLDTDGNIGWISMIGSSERDELAAVAIDALGDVVVYGESNGDLAGNNGAVDLFVAKYDTAGEQQWLAMYGGTDREESSPGSGLTFDSENNILLGAGSGSEDFYGHAAYTGDGVILKLSSTGGLLWSTRVGGNGTESITDIVEDSEGNLIVTGNTTEWGDWPGPSIGGTDFFVIKLDSQGAQLWAERIGTSASDNIEFLLKSSTDNYYVGGTVWGAAFPGFVYSGVGEDAFLVKFDGNGNIL